MFCREDGAPIPPDWVSKRFNRLIAECGLPKIRLHDLRHNAAHYQFWPRHANVERRTDHRP